MVVMRAQDSFLSHRLEKAISKLANKKRDYSNAPVFIEICNCPSKGGNLVYGTQNKEYIYKGGCKQNLLCAMIQVDKHQLLITKPYSKLNKAEIKLDLKHNFVSQKSLKDTSHTDIVDERFQIKNESQEFLKNY